MNDTVAIIDIGSNSIKLLVATVGDDSGLKTINQHVLETRISKGLGKEGAVLSEAGMKVGCESVRELADMSRLHYPRQILVTATSAVRDTCNGYVFAERIQEELGFTVRILSGEEEAHYIGLGVRQDPALKGIHHFMLFDLGGGSLELIEFSNSDVIQKVSLPLGAVRSTERFFDGGHNPITIEQITDLEDHLSEALDQGGFHFSRNTPFLVGTGGAVNYARCLVGLELKLPVAEIPSTIESKDLQHLFNHLARHSLLERTRMRGLPPERADIMPAAVLTILYIMRLANVEYLRHSSYNLRYGLASELLLQEAK